MFAFIKKNGVTIALTIGALLAVGLAVAYFFPVATAAALAATGAFFSGIASTVSGWFKKAPEAIVEPVIEPIVTA